MTHVNRVYVSKMHNWNVIATKNLQYFLLTTIRRLIRVSFSLKESSVASGWTRF